MTVSRAFLWASPFAITNKYAFTNYKNKKKRETLFFIEKIETDCFSKNTLPNLSKTPSRHYVVPSYTLRKRITEHRIRCITMAQPNTDSPMDEPTNFSCVAYPEPNHYYSTMDPRDVRTHIQTGLQQFTAVDVVVNKFTFVCTCYVRHASVEIWITVYKDDKRTMGSMGSVIEIQRRSGDGYAFCEIIRSLKAYLIVHDVIDLPDPTTVKKSGWSSKAKAKADAILAAAAAAPRSDAKVVPACAALNENHMVYRSLTGATITVPISAPLQLPPLQVTAESIRACVTHMLNMSQPGGFEDVRIEALRTLADLSSEEMPRIALMESEDHLKTLLRSATDDAPEVHRLATTVLANLMEADAAARIAVRTMNGVELFMTRATLSGVTQTIRESLRALLALYTDMSAEEKETIQSSTRFSNMIQMLGAHENSRIREYIQTIEIA